MAIGYEAHEWVDDEIGGTSIDSVPLNEMETGIAEACAGVDRLDTTLITYLVDADGATAQQDVNGNRIVEPCYVYDKTLGTAFFAPGGGAGRIAPFAGRADIELSFQDEAGLYEGRDLATVFAGEISGHGDVWEWLQERTQAGDFSGLRIGDYVDIKLTDQTDFRALVAAIDPYYQCGDTERGHHIVMMASEPVVVTGSYAVNGGYIKWNNNANNNGNSSQRAPYLASNLHAWEEGTFYNLLPAAVKSRIMVHRALLEERYSSSGALSESGGWNWYDLGHVWSPSEMEVYGCPVWGTKGWSVGYDSQWPYFKNTKRRQDGVRVGWWLRSVRGGSSSDVCFVYGGGSAGHSSATGDWIRPRPCFLIG